MLSLSLSNFIRLIYNYPFCYFPLQNLIDFFLIMQTRDYFKRVERRMDKLRRVGGLVCKKMFFSNISNLLIFSDENISFSEKINIDI